MISLDIKSSVFAAGKMLRKENADAIIGFELSETPFGEDENATIVFVPADELIAHLDVLLPETEYHVRAVAENAEGIGYGDSATFHTENASALYGTVEVEGKRVSVSLPTQLLPTAGSVSAAPAPKRRAGGGGLVTATGNAVKAPMQATIIKIAVAEGDTVVKGDLVAVLEAMKMEQPLTAHRDGTVGKIDAAVGTTVSAGHVLLSIND